MTAGVSKLKKGWPSNRSSWMDVLSDNFRPGFLKNVPGRIEIVSVVAGGSCPFTIADVSTPMTGTVSAASWARIAVISKNKNENKKIVRSKLLD